MNLEKDKYIIVEIIPTSMTPEKGEIIQLSALKLNGLQLIDRFDYRLEEKYIGIKDFLDMISYDKEVFTYKESTKDILKSFKYWSEKRPILILNNQYTKNFLQSLPNKLDYIENYLQMEYNDNIIEELIKKYKIEPTNYIVDILYESLIKSL